MEIILNRIAKRKTYTIGKLFLVHSSQFIVHSSSRSEAAKPSVPTDHESADMAAATTMNYELGTMNYFCDTLEPTWRDYAHGGHKIKGCSAIPEGRYAVVITYSPKFEAWLPLLIGDQKFNKEWQGVRIHAGNTSCDTEGCILVGQNLKKGMVLNSRIWLKRLKDKIVEAKERGEAVWLTIK